MRNKIRGAATLLALFAIASLWVGCSVERVPYGSRGIQCYDVEKCDSIRKAPKKAQKKDMSNKENKVSDAGCSSCESCEYDSCDEVSTALLHIKKWAPSHASIDEEVVIKIEVTARENVSNVVLKDQFKSNSTYVKSEPPATVEGDFLVWNFDTIDKCDSRYIEIFARSNEVGCLVDCLTVAALPRLCSATSIGKCSLCLEKEGPETLCLGSHGKYVVTASNKGNSVAKNVIVTDIIPDGLKSADCKNSVTWEIGDLEAGCCVSLPLCLEAVKRGNFCNLAKATADNAPEVTAEACTKVVFSDVSITKTGNAEQFIGKNAKYTISVSNNGDVDLSNVVVSDIIPRETSLVDSGGSQCCQGNAIWEFDVLKAGQSKSVNLTLSNNCTGTTTNKATVYACSEMCGPQEDCTTFDTLWKGHPGLLIEMVDVCDPMLIGEITCYKIRVSNQGTASDQNVVIVARFPKELKPAEAYGMTKATISGQTVTFAPVSELCPGECVDYEISVEALSTGDARVKVEMSSEVLDTPVVEEESTHIY
jgi:uncharacterized repeat protein (TIGR01451 family)